MSVMPRSTSASSPARMHSAVDLGLAALVLLLDPVRMDPAVEHELLQREPTDLAADRVEAGEQHRLRRVVDDQVDAGHRLEGPDVAPLAPDDPALHVIARQVQHGDDRLGGLLARDPLDRQRHDLAGPQLALVTCLGLDVTDEVGRVALRLGLDHLDQLGLGLGHRQAGDPFELALGPRRRCARSPRAPARSSQLRSRSAMRRPQARAAPRDRSAAARGARARRGWLGAGRGVAVLERLTVRSTPTTRRRAPPRRR